MKKKIYYALIILFSGVFIFCAVQVVSYFIEARQHVDYYNNLASIMANASVSRPIPTGTRPTQDSNPTQSSPIPTEPSASSQPTVPATEPTEKTMLAEMAVLYQLNPHTVGWIQIEGTRVNYPVVQTPDEAGWRDYYLYKDFEGNYDIHGSIYAREACDIFAPSDNITIYGHNMADHSMFGELFDYKYYSYYEKHRYIYFDTLYEHHTYEIYAIFRTSASLGEGFAYHLFSDAASKAEFDTFVQTCKGLSMHKLALTPQYGDKLITLSTCDFHIDNGRLVICAVRLD